jgi:hypothetical protein
MFRSSRQNANRTAWRGRIAASFLAALALGISALNSLTGRGIESFVVGSSVGAAEPLPVDEPAPAEDELSHDQGSGKPARASNNAAPLIEYFPRPTKADTKVIEALDQPTRIEFLDLPLEDALGFLKDFHKINLWLDRVTLTDEGVGMDQPVTLKLAGVTLRSVLKLLLEPMQLTYIIEDGVMKITTVAKAGEKLITRTYPVHDLYRGRIIAADQPRDEKGATGRTSLESRRGDLETAIVKSIEPESWDENKGPGSMTYIAEAGSLVIRQSSWVHDQILDLLRDLREAKRAIHGAPNEQAAPTAGFRLRGRKRDETYSVVGIMDLDGDGEDDGGRLRRLINLIGASIDNDIDGEGKLLVNGETPDPYKPEITEKTKFVILGKIPQAADLSDPDEIATGLKIAGLYKDLEDQARALGVRIIRLNEFLRYIGYESSEGKTERSRP